jgi:iron complex transport system permease protein
MSATVRIGPLAVPVRVRAVIFCAVTAAVLVVVAVLSLTLGSAGIPLAELPSVLLGRAEGMAEFVFERLRGPRLATAIFAGALLGVSGALFQTVTRNPLGSPDVIGLGAGAGAGVAVTTLVVPVVPPSLGAVLGAAVATGLVFVSTGRGFRSPARTIIAGIAVAALAYAVTQYIVSTQLRDAASQLAEYLVGSLNVRNAQHVLVTGVGAAVLLCWRWGTRPPPGWASTRPAPGRSPCACRSSPRASRSPAPGPSRSWRSPRRRSRAGSSARPTSASCPPRSQAP